MKLWTIYCHTHIESGKRYIGLTSRTMERRWSDHLIVAKKSKDGRWHFPNAIRKYGKDAFSHEILAMSWNLEGANATEINLINQYDTTNPEKGFNLLKGGRVYINPKLNDLEYKTKRSIISKEIYSRPGVKEKVLAAINNPIARANNKASLNTPESKAKRTEISKSRGKYSDEMRMKTSEAVLKSFTPEIRAKICSMNREIRSRPEVRKRASDSIKANRVRFFRAKMKIEAMTHLDCKIHGSIPLNECKSRLNPNGTMRYECKICVSDQKKNWYYKVR